MNTSKVKTKHPTNIKLPETCFVPFWSFKGESLVHYARDACTLDQMLHNMRYILVCRMIAECIFATFWSIWITMLQFSSTTQTNLQN